MENIIDLVLYMGILSWILMPAVILCWIAESTKIGRRFMDWVLRKMGVDLDDYDEDDEDYYA